MSVTDKRVWFNMKEPNTKVLLDVDREKFIEYLSKANFKLDLEV